MYPRPFVAAHFHPVISLMVSRQTFEKAPIDSRSLTLRTSKQQALKQLHQDGEKAGGDFALHIAEYLELERLDRWRDNAGGNLALVVSQTSFMELGRIMANEDGSEDDTVEWARERWGDDMNQSAWVEGFVAGALAKYHELRKALGGA